MSPYVKNLVPPRSRDSSDAGLMEPGQDKPIRDFQHHKKLSIIVSEIKQEDAGVRDEVETGDSGIQSPISISSSVTKPEKIILSWEDGDPENPYNWSSERKASFVALGLLVVVNSTMGSALPSNAIPVIAEYFHIKSSAKEILPISIYLVGYIVGPLFFGPLSESYGRKNITISAFVFFTIFTMACAVAPNWESLLIFRFLTGVNGSSPMALVAGLYADLFDDPVTRGRAMAIFLGGACAGPLIVPGISGFVAPVLGWRWVFWIALMVAGASCIPLLFLTETYGPVLLAQRAAKLRKSTGNSQIFAPIELEKKGFKQLATVTLTRPLRMMCFELIVCATCMYLSLAYGIFYIYFISYPIVFQGIYHQSHGVSGLMFLPIIVGAFSATAISLAYDSLLQRARAQNRPWTTREESRRLPLACLGGPLYVVALLWLGWTAREGVPFWVPMLAGVPLGMGFILIFMALLNYLTDAYGVFAASAMAAASCCRSVAGAVLPFAAASAYERLGVAWASSLLGFLSLGMCIVPFVFLWKGDVLRERSTFCQYLKEKRREDLEELERARVKARAIGSVDGVVCVGANGREKV